MEERILESEIAKGALFVFAYFLGTVPVGRLFAAYYKIPLKERELQYKGAANIFKLVSNELGSFVLLLDILKGYIAVNVVGYFDTELSFVATIGVVYGNMLPLWIYCRGGSGVLVFTGALLAFEWQLALAYISVWIMSSIIVRGTKFGACITALCSMLYVALFHDGERIYYTTNIISVAMLIKHKKLLGEFIANLRLSRYLTKVHNRLMDESLDEKED